MKNNSYWVVGVSEEGEGIKLGGYRGLKWVTPKS